MENMAQYGESLGLSMWMGTVPTSQKLPAVAFNHVADKRTRTVDGKVSGLVDVWNLIVVANNYGSAKSLLDKLNEADNMETAFYETVHITGTQLLVPSEGDSIYRISVDIETT